MVRTFGVTLAQQPVILFSQLHLQKQVSCGRQRDFFPVHNFFFTNLTCFSFLLFIESLELADPFEPLPYLIFFSASIQLKFFPNELKCRTFVCLLKFCRLSRHFAGFACDVGNFHFLLQLLVLFKVVLGDLKFVSAQRFLVQSRYDGFFSFCKQISLKF